MLDYTVTTQHKGLRMNIECSLFLFKPLENNFSVWHAIRMLIYVTFTIYHLKISLDHSRG